MSDSTVFPFQPITMTSAQLAAVSHLTRYSGRTHKLYAYQLRRRVAITWTQRDPAGVAFRAVSIRPSAAPITMGASARTADFARFSGATRLSKRYEKGQSF